MYITIGLGVAILIAAAVIAVEVMTGEVLPISVFLLLLGVIVFAWPAFIVIVLLDAFRK